MMGMIDDGFLIFDWFGEILVIWIWVVFVKENLKYWFRVLFYVKFIYRVYFRIFIFNIIFILG